MLLGSSCRVSSGRGSSSCTLLAMGRNDRCLRQWSRDLGIQSNVRFHGWIPHVEVQNRLRTCDFMALPSIREFGGAVVVESMALGVTPIVADYAGPSELVDDKTGIRVPFHDKKSLVEGMRRAIGNVIRSPKMLDIFGTAGREKVLRKLTWEAKARQILNVYEAVLSGAKNLNYLDFH